MWYPHKVKTIVEWFGQYPDKSVVFTNADLIDETGKSYTMDTLFDRVGFERDMREYFDSGCELPMFYYCNHATGQQWRYVRNLNLQIVVPKTAFMMKLLH